MTRFTPASARASLMIALRRSCGIALLFLFSIGSAVAQSNGSGQKPGAPAGSYKLSDFDTVNLYNGNLNFHLPLLGIGGRGEAQMGIVLALDVNQWSVEHEIRPVCPVGEENCIPPDFPVYNTPEGSRSPLNLVGTGYGPGKLSVRRTGGFPYNSCQSPNKDYYHRTLTVMTFMASNGTTYELRDQLTNGEPKEVTTLPCSTPDWGFNRGSVFVSTDGTSATFISTDANGNPVPIYDKNLVSSSGVGSASGYLMLRDGTRYRIEGGLVRWMRDRNGNLMNFEYYTDTNNSWDIGKVSRITDSLNREVTFAYTATQDTITYNGFGGAARTIKIIKSSLAAALRDNYGTTARTYGQLFPELSALFDPDKHWPHHIYDPQVRKSVILPDGRSYQLRYNPYGDLARVELPTGGAIEYDYTPGSGVIPGEPAHYNIYREVRERRVYPDGVTLEGSMKYSYETMQGTIATVKHCKGAAVLAVDKHYYLGNPRVFEVPPEPTEDQYLEFDYDVFSEGREYKSESLERDGVTVLRRTEHTWENRAPVAWWTHGQASAPPNDPRITQTVSTLMDVSPNLVMKQTFDYDEYNNQTDVHEYDFGNGQAGPRLRHTHTDYLKVNPVNGQNYATDTDIHIRNLPVKQQVFQVTGGTEVEQARITYEYDKYTGDSNHAALVARSLISGLDAAFTSSNQTRGNLTATSRWLLPNDKVTSFQQYDVAGNVVKAIDARGYVTTIDYTDNFGEPDGAAQTNKIRPDELVPQYSYAFATRVVNALGHEAFTQYDYHLGRAVDTESADGVVTSVYYGGLLDRPTRVISDANNLLAKSQTTFTYVDASHIVRINSDLNTYGDNKLKSETVYDGLGRTVETRSFETGVNYIRVELKYDALGRVSQKSNPYRPYLSETVLWTTTGYDDLGRVISVKTPDNAVARTVYSGNTVAVTDQAGKDRESRTDALGRLKAVVEDPGTNGLNYSTQYTYDAMNNLLTVHQGAQTRTFVYDSLSRLQSADNPENGTITYEYDVGGNLLKKTDERKIAPNSQISVAVSFTYDALSRIKTKSYNLSGTQTVAYFYDQEALPSGAPAAPDFTRGASKGRLVAVTYGGTSAGSYYGYDALGRVKQSVQRTDGQSYGMSYEYNLAGGMTSQSYPSGRVVRTAYDGAGRLSSVKGEKGSQVKTYASSFGYASHGALSKVKLGNGLWEHTNYEPKRLQTTEIGLGISAIDSSQLKLTYSYGGVTNNGNVISQTTTVPGLTLTESITYDELNRLDTTIERRNGSIQWRQSFTYDRYGNRRLDETSTTAALVGPNPAISASNNRISSNGYSYDEVGNLLHDGAGHTYTYDAECRMVSFDAGAASYTYDGTGQRVKKVVGTGSLAVTTIFVYDAGGTLVAEYATNTEGSQKGTSYVTVDRLGSTRLVTDGKVVTARTASSAIKARYDYLPFGEEIASSYGGRSSVAGYPTTETNGIRQKFTGYERDIETGLDFAQARYYANTHGRFTSADSVGGSSASPQSLNRYSYTYNNPLNMVDPSGHSPFDAKYNGSGDGFGYPDYMGGPTGSSAIGLARYEARLQNTREAMTADAAYNRGDTGAGDALLEANPTLSKVNADAGTEAAAAHASAPQDTVVAPVSSSSNATMIIIWNPVAFGSPSSAFGHVSYITMQDDTSLSWPESILNPNDWGRISPSSKYTNERSDDSAGRGYVLDFGPKLNAKFQEALKHAYDKLGGGQHMYGIWNYNCGRAFNVAINAIRGDLRKQFKVKLPESKGVLPSTIEAYIRNKIPRRFTSSGGAFFPKH